MRNSYHVYLTVEQCAGQSRGVPSSGMVTIYNPCDSCCCLEAVGRKSLVKTKSTCLTVRMKVGRCTRQLKCGTHDSVEMSPIMERFGFVPSVRMVLRGDEVLRCIHSFLKSSVDVIPPRPRNG